MTTTASDTVAARHRELLARLPFDDRADYEAATRGFLGTLDPPVIRDAGGRGPGRVGPGLVLVPPGRGTRDGQPEPVAAVAAAHTSTGTFSLIPPTLTVSRTGQVEVVDGVRMVFQMAPGTEAPAELHFHLPDHRALCTAENATRTLHNILTIRGALVRDPHEWARYLTEMIELFGDDTDVAFASHHWPTWGHDEVIEYLGLQRDLYAYLHDQTVRMLNAGLVGSEIAEAIELPPALEHAWHARGYYGSVSHNVKAIYQRYMGWYDANPAHLWQHPQLFDSMAVRVNGPRCWGERIEIDIDLDDGERYRLRLANGVLTHSTAAQASPPDLTLRMPGAALAALVAGTPSAEALAAARVRVEGDLGALPRLVAALDAPDPNFAIVTP